MASNLPRARRSDLIVQQMEQEIVVYDSVGDKANVLNVTAAAVWQACDGQRTVSEIAALVSRELGSPVNEAVVYYTLDQLAKKNLLETRAAVPAQYQRLTRRDFLRAGLVGAAVVVPVIVTMTVPKAASAQGSCGGNGSQCLSATQCCSGCCNLGTCSPQASCD